MRDWFSGRTVAFQAARAGPIPASRTTNELNGFFKARRWDALRASHLLALKIGSDLVE